MAKTNLEAEKEQLEKSIAEKQSLLAILEKEGTCEAKKLVKNVSREIREQKGRLNAVTIIIEARETNQRIREIAESSAAFLSRIAQHLGERFDETVEDVKRRFNEEKKD